MGNNSNTERDIIFISKATPGDDSFALWLAPKLEAAGYKVFADIVCLGAGDRWRQKITRTLQDNAVKMVLCCSDETLNREGVQEEIEIALDLSKELDDPNFVIPLKLKPYKKLFGIGGLQYINFENQWAEGLQTLLSEFQKHTVPRVSKGKIQPHWEQYHKRKQLDSNFKCNTQ